MKLGEKIMKETVHIIGHKNPDTDSICSALAYADYKNNSGEAEAIPVRLGDINRETEFVLDYFKLDKPELMETVRLSVEDLEFDNIAAISPNISLRMALNIMTKNGIHSLPVVDDNEKLIGVVTVSDIVQSYIDVWDNSFLGKADVSIENIIDTLSAKAVLIPESKRPYKGELLVLSMNPSSLEEYVDENDIVICGDRKDIQEIAIKRNISLMILTDNSKINEELIKIAKQRDITIISTPLDTFTTSRLISQSVSVNHVMTTEDLLVFSLDDLVDDVRIKMSQTRYRNYPVINHENKVIGSISRYHLISSRKKNVILVDHNERSQSIDGLEEAKILEIIDHHRIGDVFTGQPIYFRNEPVGSTCTIIASIMFENGRRPSKKIAGILSAGIISDTLLFRSPTSTSTDKIMLDRLARIADLDVEEFAVEMFKAGTSLTGQTPQELLSQDFKAFTINDYKIGISQVFTMDSESLEDMRDDLIDLMEERAREYGYSIFMLMLTNIFEQASEIVAVGQEKNYAAQAFDERLVNDSFYAPGVLSRKKQVVPPITNTLSAI